MEEGAGSPQRYAPPISALLLPAAPATVILQWKELSGTLSPYKSWLKIVTIDH